MADAAPDAPAIGPCMSGDAAAAILLTLLDEPEAATVLASLNPGEAQRIGRAMLDVARATTTDIETALNMFVDKSMTITGLGLDAAPRVRSVFTAALGETRAETLLSDIAPHGSDKVMEALRWMPTVAITQALTREHPQVAALILTCLDPEAAAAALAPLDEDRQCDLVYRAASLGSVSAAALRDLEDVLQGYSAVPKAGSSVRVANRSDIAKIVTHLPKGTDLRVLKGLKKRDKALAQDIEDDMFVFDDLASLDDKNMGALLRSIESAVLTLALRGAQPSTVDRMLGCLSARAADTIRDEMAESAPAKRADVEAAQKEIAAAARRMAEAGDLMLGGQNNDYV